MLALTVHWLSCGGSMRIHHLLLALFLFPFIAGADDTGCQSQDSSSVEQSKIYTTYWLYYNVNTDTTYARAQFRFGGATGTTLQLSDGASVTFEGKALTFNELLDWQEVVLPGKVSSGSFVYTDTKGTKYSNPVPAISEIEFAAVPATISKSQAYQLTWTGTPLADDEVLEVVVVNAANNFLFSRVDQRNRNATDVVLPANELGKLPSGASLLTMRRHRDYPLAQGTSLGGKLTTTYQPRDRPFSLQ
jgi:hypothetical protein